MYSEDKRFYLRSGRFGFGYMIKYVEGKNNKVIFETDCKDQIEEVFKDIDDHYDNNNFPNPIRIKQPKLFIHRTKYYEMYYLVNSIEEYEDICHGILVELKKQGDWNFTIDNSPLKEIVSDEVISNINNERLRKNVIIENEQNKESNKAKEKHNILAEKLNKAIENKINSAYYLSQIDYDNSNELTNFSNV